MKRLSPQAARERSRALLWLAALSVVAMVLLIVGRPTFVGDPRFADPMEIPDAIPLGMAVFGLAWMVRIYRRDPEAGPSAWRFHRWD